MAVFDTEENAISIHSLVKRETQDFYFLWLPYRHFNPLPRKEGDGDLYSIKISDCYFNPLPRKEGDSSGLQSLQ